MNKKIALLDFDGTLSKGYISMEFMDYLHDRELYGHDSYEKQKEILKKYESGIISYDDWCKEWGILWASGFNSNSRNEVTAAAKDFFEQFKQNVYPSSVELISFLKKKNYETVMVSTGAREAVIVAAEYLGIDKTYATEVSFSDGHYSGRLLTHFHLPDGKKDFIEELKKTNLYSWDDSLAFGDSTHDIEMLEAVEIPIALNAQRKLVDMAEKEHWYVCNHNSVVEVMKKLLF